MLCWCLSGGAVVLDGSALDRTLNNFEIRDPWTEYNILLPRP